jgi:hypothetical protein
MIEILHFKRGAQIIKLITTVASLNVMGNLMCHCRRDKNMEKNHLTGQVGGSRKGLPFLPLSFHLQGRHVTGHQQREVSEAEVCVVSEAVSFEVSISMKIYIMIF